MGLRDGLLTVAMQKRSDVTRWDSAAWAALMRPQPLFPPANVWGCTTMAAKYGGTYAVSPTSKALAKARKAQRT